MAVLDAIVKLTNLIRMRLVSEIIPPGLLNFFLYCMIFIILIQIHIFEEVIAMKMKLNDPKNDSFRKRCQNLMNIDRLNIPWFLFLKSVFQLLVVQKQNSTKNFRFS